MTFWLGLVPRAACFSASVASLVFQRLIIYFTTSQKHLGQSFIAVLPAAEKED